MKLSEVIPFVTFAQDTDHQKIEQQFNNNHSNYKLQFPYWSVGTTRKKLTGQFWYAAVSKNFLVLYALALLYQLPIHTIYLINQFYWQQHVYLALYLFAFYGSYLPLLESYLENHSGKQLEGIQKFQLPAQKIIYTQKKVRKHSLLGT